MTKSSNDRPATPRRPRGLLRRSVRLGFLRDDDPSLALASIVCQVAARELQADRVAVLRPTRDAGRYVMYAGYGWPDQGSVQHLVDAAPGSLLARARDAARAVVVADLDEQAASGADGWLEDAAPGSAVLVSAGNQPPPSAMLAAFRNAPGPFAPADVARVETTARFVRLVFDQRTTREVLEHVWTMLDSTSDFIGTTDASGRDRYLNKAARVLFGLESAADVDRFRLRDAYPPDEYRRMKERAYPAARRGGIWRGETVLLRHDGVRVPVSQVTVVQRDARGRTLYLSTTARDITEEKRAQAEQAERLARTERQRQAILRIATSEAVVRGNRQQALTEVCEAAARAMQVPFACIWELSGDQSELRCIAANGSAPPDFLRPGTVRRARAYPRYFEALHSGRALAVANALADPRTREFRHECREPVGIRAILDAPIRIGGRIVGVIGHKHTGAPRDWAPDETDFCAQLADQVAQVLLHVDRERARKALARSEQRYRALVETAPVAYLLIEPTTGRILDANDNALRLFGLPRARLLKLRPVDLSPPRQRDGRPSEEAAREVFATTRRGEMAVFEWLHRDAQGSERICEVRLAAVPSADRDTMQASIIDVTDRVRAEEARRASEARYRVLYDQNPAMFFTLDATGRILSVNRFGAGHLGYSVDDLLGRNLAELEVGAEKNKLADNLESCLAEPGRYHRWEDCLAKSDRSLVWVRTTARSVTGDGRESELLLVCEDHTETYRLSEKLSHQASHDQLTGLYNRRWLERQVERLLEGVRESGAEHALCYLDIDNFKVINETCGHVAGDELLRRLGEVMQHHVGPRDALARLGGDEFGVLLTHRSLADAERTTRDLRNAVRDFRFDWQGSRFSVRASIGLVPITPASGDLSQILSEADAACFAAKEEGRNRIHVHRAGDRKLARRYGEMQWVSRLRRALEEDRFELHWQRIVPLRPAEDERHHYELLVRMRADDGTLIPPDRFLPAAERYNLAPELDRWVVGHALDWLARQPGHRERLDLCAINLSGQSLGDDDFLAFLQRRLQDDALPADRLCLEITETAAIGDLYNAVRFMDTLRRLGVHFALDDFGSGLSSFAYLRSLPVDYLKIDGVFVKDIADDPIALAVVKSINEIGKVMGKRTIAEFAENEHILRRLREIGVDYAQGYGVDRPRPLHELSAADGATPTDKSPG